MLRILAADMRHFEQVLEQIGAQPFVARTKSVLVLSPLLRRRRGRRPQAPHGRPEPAGQADELAELPRQRNDPPAEAANKQRIAANGQHRAIVGASRAGTYREPHSASAPGPPRLDPWSEPMTSVLSHPQPSRERTATRRRYLMCRPAALRRQLRDQPVDGPAGPGRPGPRAAPVGRPCATPTATSATASTSCRRSPACRTWSTRPTAPPCSTAPCSAPGSGTASAGPRRPRTAAGSSPPASPAWSEPAFVNEGEGDLLVAGPPDDRVLLAGTGFRTDPRAHAEAAAVLGCPVLPLELVDPRFYHLDTALAVLDARHHRLAAGGVLARRPASCWPTASRTRWSPTRRTRPCSG